MKKIVSICVILAMLVALVPTTVLGWNTDTANKLRALNLFRGTDRGDDLDKTFTRAQAATILVRLFGDESYVKSRNYSNQFKDVPNNHWAMKYIAYCYENGITKGVSATEYAPEREITAKEFVALVLRALGYGGITLDNAYSEAIRLSLFSSNYAKDLSKQSPFLRNSMVDIVYKALRTKMANGKLLAQYLADKGVFSVYEAQKQNVLPTSSGDILDDIDKASQGKLN